MFKVLAQKQNITQTIMLNLNVAIKWKLKHFLVLHGKSRCCTDEYSLHKCWSGQVRQKGASKKIKLYFKILSIILHFHFHYTNNTLSKNRKQTCKVQHITRYFTPKYFYGSGTRVQRRKSWKNFPIVVKIKTEKIWSKNSWQIREM